MYAHTHIYIYTYISQHVDLPNTRYVWEAEPGVPDE